MPYNVLEKVTLGTFCYASEPWQSGFQDSATPTVEGMIDFHNYIMIFLIAIGFFVVWVLYQIRGVNHGFMPIVVKGVFVDILFTRISAKLSNLVFY